ncbi:retrovirus-related Pol polyprotein from transposon 17.6 [Trichonephila clavipes]|nr:retrovirus-related Pol polyprotein from transposon 17.6 [Trichonephila clavipes]
MEDAVELIHSIGRANIITTLDLLKGYWAIPMAEIQQNLTSFKTHRQQYRFKIPKKTAVINNLPVKRRRSFVVYLDCVIYREYIPKYSELVYPRTHQKLPDSIPWTEKHDSSFHLLKKALVEAPSLYSPVPDKPYTIHSDASQIGIAACLSQKCGDKCYPIAYASQKLSKTQQSWSTIEREAFAIVWSLKSLKYGYLGLKLNFILIITLPYLTKSAPQSARLQRWAFALQKVQCDNQTLSWCKNASC